MSDLNFLKLIYELGGSLHNVSNGDIAKKAHLSNASVTERTKSIAENTGLLSYTKYYGSRLTEKGILLINPYIQQQRLIEVWLVNDLDFSLEEAHKESDILTNKINTQFIDRLNDRLNYPKFCPHGNIIPNNSQMITDNQLTLVDNLVLDQKYIVKSFAEDSYIFSILETIDIKLQDTVQLLSVAEDNIIIFNLRTDTKQLLPKTLGINSRRKKEFSHCRLNSNNYDFIS
ncbi:metal-dependent transcriptional regulator [Companilactobacillus jidongensis]|uniref:metal-dependent transcriptional regulator n=1 Tax=Companilactobacillus jidongensis TaxID=2486006 RepID=UPI000F79A77D|nr:metal-dependent transcriptional regulator [Companilactobacillus jidongensis]